MAFDLGAWMIGQALGKTLGKILALGDSLQSRLQAATDFWALRLSQGERCNASAILNFNETLFEVQNPEGMWRLQESIHDSGVPSSRSWAADLLTNYRCNKRRQGQETRDLFLVAEIGAGELLGELVEDRNCLSTLRASARALCPRMNAELKALPTVISGECSFPISLRSLKVIGFTAFAVSAQHLYDQITPWGQRELGVESTLVTGDGRDRGTLQRLRRELASNLSVFAPRAMECTEDGGGGE